MAPMRLRAVGHTTYDIEDEPRQLRESPAGLPSSPAPSAHAGPPRRRDHRPAPQAHPQPGLVSRPAAPAGQDPLTASPPGDQAAPDPGPDEATAADVDVDIDPSAAYLLARLRIVETRVRVLVAHRRRDDPAPDDPFRGLYLSDEHVDRLLAGDGEAAVIEGAGADDLAVLEDAAARIEAAGTPIRLRRLAEAPPGSTISTWICCWSPWRPTWTAASNACTATSTMT